MVEEAADPLHERPDGCGVGGDAEQVAHSPVVGKAPQCSTSETWSGMGAPNRKLRSRAIRQSGPTVGWGPADLGGSVPDRGDSAAPVARGCDRTGSAQPCDRSGRPVGQCGCCAWCGAGVGFPDAEVNEHVRVELRDGLGDSGVLVGMNPVVYHMMQTAPRWIGSHARQFTHPTIRPRAGQWWCRVLLSRHCRKPASHPSS